jgi:hypothetical protein
VRRFIVTPSRNDRPAPSSPAARLEGTTELGGGSLSRLAGGSLSRLADGMRLVRLLRSHRPLDGTERKKPLRMLAGGTLEGGMLDGG